MRTTTLTVLLSVLSSFSPTVAVGAAVGAPSAAADRIVKIGAKNPIQADVVSEDYKEVKYRPAGIKQTQSIESHKVERVIYADAPESFTKALDFLAQGDTANAITNLQAAANEKAGSWLKVHSLYYLGEAYLLSGARNATDYAKAADTFEKLLKDHPECRFLPRALKRWGDALSRARDPDSAATVYDRLDKEAADKKLSIIWEARAKLLKAEAYKMNDVAAKAKTAYQAAGNFARANAAQQKDPTIQAELQAIAGMAQLSEGESLLANKDYAGARRSFERIAQDSSASPESVALAECGLGEVFLGEGRLPDALQQFARVRIRHFLKREATARATYQLGMVCLALKDKEPNGKRKAREYFTEVVEHYGDTNWADLARAQLR